VVTLSKPALKRKSVFFFVGLVILEGLLTIVWLVNIPSDPKNIFLFGLSQQRLLLLLGIVIGISGITTFFLFFLRKHSLEDQVYRWIDQKRFHFVGFITGFVLLIILLIPLNKWGDYSAIFERLRPIVVWIILISFQWFILPIIAEGQLFRRIWNWFRERLGPQYKIFIVCLFFFVSFYTLSTILYSQANKDYWNETGVPILAWQLLLAGLGGFLFCKLEKPLLRIAGKKANLITFLLVFILSGLLWGLSPLQPSYLNPGPFPPNNIFYPFSDAAKFDLEAQSSLLGLGLNNGLPLDRPFYPLFLAIIHWFSGQSYPTNMLIQASIFAFFPAIIFLIGAELGSRSGGIVAAIAISFWGVNTIQASNWLNTATPKQMLSDFPTAVLLSLVLFLSIKWLKQTDKKFLYACLVGALIALTALIRYSALVLLPVWMVIAFISNNRNPKKGMIEASLLLTSFLVFIAPWYSRNILAGQPATLPFSNKILFVIRTRYQSGEINLYEKRWQTTPTSAENLVDSNTIDQGIDSFPETKLSTQVSEKPAFLFASHFIHNIMSSLLILPTSLEMVSLRTSIDLGGEIWSPSWNGVLSPCRTIVLLFQFVILSAGITGLRKKEKETAVFILIFLGIHIANALGRTSGGRYIVPVDWMVIPVYIAGIFSILGIKVEKVGTERGYVEYKKRSLLYWIGVFVLIGLVGALPVFYERVSQSFISYEKPELSLEEINSLSGYSISESVYEEMKGGKSSGNLRMLEGYAFYPRQASKSKFELPPRLIGKLSPEVYLRFNFLNSNRNMMVYFPYAEDIKLQSQDKVVLFGCSIGDSFLARDLFVIENDSTRYYYSDLVFDSCDNY
jgi:hypothetical protein